MKKRTVARVFEDLQFILGKTLRVYNGIDVEPEKEEEI